MLIFRYGCRRLWHVLVVDGIPMLYCPHMSLSRPFLLLFLILGGVLFLFFGTAHAQERPSWDSFSAEYAGVGIGYRAGVRFFRDVSADLRGGDPAPLFSVKVGTSLPAGLQLTGTGYLVGTPTGAGASRFTVVARNTAGVAEKQITLRLREPLSNTHAQGDTHPDILDTQIFLNSTDCSVAETGPGSPGQETSYFGTKTQQALACYQQLHNLPAGDTLTPTLFQHFIQIYADRFIPGDFTLPPGTIPLRAAQDAQGREHSFGTTHPDIRQVQVYLNSTSCPVAETGPGSPGQETAYFGTKTQQALNCYQRLHNLPVTSTITPTLLAHLAGISLEEHGVCDLSVSQGCAVGTPVQHEPSYISRGERWRCRSVSQGYSSDWCVRCDDGYTFDGRNCSRTAQGTTSFRCSETTLAYCRLPRSVPGATVTGTCSAGRVGTCQYTCNNGTWQFVSNTCSRPDTPQGHSPGTTHADVRQAQVYLNGTPCPVAKTGPGSPGQETAYFGTKTQQALNCYQRLHNLPVTSTITPTLLTHLSEHSIPPTSNTPQDISTPRQSPPDSPPVPPVTPQNGVCDLTVSQGCTVGTPIYHEPSYISRGERWRCRGVNQGYSSDWCVRCDDGYSFDGRNCSRTTQRTTSFRCSGTTLAYCRLSQSAHGNTAAGTCTAGRTGTCQYTCSNGTWQFVSNTCSLAQPNDPNNGGLSGNRAAQPRTGQPQQRVGQPTQYGDHFGYAVGVGGNVSLRPCDLKRCCDPSCSAKTGCRWCVECDELCTECDWHKLRCRKRVQTAIVGSYFTGNGLVYIYVRHEDASGQVEWRLQAKIAADDGQAGDAFGSAVAIDEDVAIVGAPGDDTNAGSAYIFMRVFKDRKVQWVQQAKLTADDRASADYFGSTVAIDGATAVVGAYSENPGGTQDAGSAYVFVRSADEWDFQEKLIADDGGRTDHFGYSVAVSGRTISVGAYHDDPGYKSRAGSVYTFGKPRSKWVQQRKVIADDRQPNDQLGNAVAVVGENCTGGNCCIPVDGRWSTVPMPYELPCGKVVKATCTNPAPSCGGSPCVGPPPESHGTACGSGKCDIVTRQCKQSPCCGSSCILGITTCRVINRRRYCPRCVYRPARWESPSCQDASEIRCGAKIPNTDGVCIMGQTCDCRGIDCSGKPPVRTCTGTGTNCPSGSRTVAGANQDGAFVGSAYLLSNDRQTKVVANDKSSYAWFGSAVDINEYVFVAGTPGESVGNAGNVGSVYVFSTGGSQRAKLFAKDRQRHDYFGYAVSAYDALMTVGAYGRDLYDGVAYVFTSLDGAWKEEVQLTGKEEVQLTSRDVPRIGGSTLQSGSSSLSGGGSSGFPPSDIPYGTPACSVVCGACASGTPSEFSGTTWKCSGRDASIDGGPLESRKVITIDCSASHCTLNACRNVRPPVCKGDKVQTYNCIYHAEPSGNRCTCFPNALVSCSGGCEGGRCVGSSGTPVQESCTPYSEETRSCSAYAGKTWIHCTCPSRDCCEPRPGYCGPGACGVDGCNSDSDCGSNFVCVEGRCASCQGNVNRKPWCN